jgi:hypothetical protein
MEKTFQELPNWICGICKCRDRNRHRKVRAGTLVENFSNQPYMTESVDQSTLEDALDRLRSNRLVRVFPPQDCVRQLLRLRLVGAPP